MLKIFVYGPSENGYLDLDPAARLDMEEYTPLFDEELNTGEFSLPFDGIMWTDNNRRLLGHAERIDSNERQTEFLINVYDDDFPEITKGKLTLLNRQGKYHYRSGKFSATISGSKGMFGSVIRGKTLKDLSFDIIDFGSDNSRQWAQKFMEDDFPELAHILSFCPVAIEGFFDTDRGDYAGEFIAKDTVNNVVIKDTEWFFGRPTSADPDDPAIPGTEEYIDYRTVPFMKLKNVVRKCFEDFGYTVTGDFIDTSDFNDLVLFNNYAIEQYDVENFADLNRKLNPINHLPKVLIAEFLKAVFTFLNIKIDFEADNKVVLTFRKNYLLTRTFKTIDDIVLDVFETQYEEGVKKDGYNINYTWDSNDGYYSDRVKDLGNKTIAATVATYTDLLTLDIGRSFTTDDLVLVEAENMYYQPADATVLPVVKWDAYAERLHEYRAGNAEETKELLMSTLAQYVVFNEAEGVTQPAYYLGTRQKGSYINNKGILVQNEYGLRVFYSRFYQPASSSVSRPTSLNHNRDYLNDVMFFHSLSLLGAGGLIEDLHQEWQDARRNAEIIKADIRSNRQDVMQVKAKNTIVLQGRRFLLQKMERTIPLESSVKLFLVEL